MLTPVHRRSFVLCIAHVVQNLIYAFAHSDLSILAVMAYVRYVDLMFVWRTHVCIMTVYIVTLYNILFLFLCLWTYAHVCHTVCSNLVAHFSSDYTLWQYAYVIWCKRLTKPQTLQNCIATKFLITFNYELFNCSYSFISAKIRNRIIGFDKINLYLFIHLQIKENEVCLLTIWSTQQRY